MKSQVAAFEVSTGGSVPGFDFASANAGSSATAISATASTVKPFPLSLFPIPCQLPGAANPQNAPIGNDLLRRMLRGGQDRAPPGGLDPDVQWRRRDSNSDPRTRCEG